MRTRPISPFEFDPRLNALFNDAFDSIVVYMLTMQQWIDDWIQRWKKDNKKPVDIPTMRYVWSEAKRLYTQGTK